MDELKKVLKQANLTQSDIADALGIKSLSTINLKLNGKAILTTHEAGIIKNLINERLGTNYILEDLFYQSEE